MTLFLLSLTGIPPLAGFFAKAVIILGALEVGGAIGVLAVILMLNAAAAAFYYLRVVVYMYMRQPAEDAGRSASARLTRARALLAAVADDRHRPRAAHHGRDARLDRGRGGHARRGAGTGRSRTSAEVGGVAP